MLSCQRCKQTNNGPQAFLLTCRGCSKTWHHRCHMPPVEDEELIQRIRATNAGDTANGLGAWACRRCKKSASEIPSAMSSREPTVSSDSRENGSSSTATVSAHNPTVTTASVASAVDVCVKQESGTAVDARLLNNQQRSTAAPPVKRVLTAKRARPSAVEQPHVQPQQSSTRPSDLDVHMADTTPTKQEKVSSQRPSFPIPLRQGKSARKSLSIVPATSSEDDVEMEVEVFPPAFNSKATSRVITRASQVPPPDDQVTRVQSVAEALPHARAASFSFTNEREREVRPADGAAIQPRVNQDAANEIDDDPDDLYGPPVERRIIRILPSLAQELREQQRRAAPEKEKRRAPLAPDWILAKHVHDPSWKEIPTEGRKRRKPTARKLGDNGLNVNELMDCFTVQNWVREHKT